MWNLGSLMDREFLVLAVSQRTDSVTEEQILEKGRFVILMRAQKIVRVFRGLSFLAALRRVNGSPTLEELDGWEDFAVIPENLLKSDIRHLSASIAIAVETNGFPVGVIDHASALVNILNQPNSKTLPVDCEKIVECLEEEVFVTDAQGYVVYLNPEAERVCGVSAGEIIGKHVDDLEREQIASSCITPVVIREKKKVSLMQKLKTGKTVLGTGVPVFNENGELFRIICTSKDVKEINKLIEEIEKKNIELHEKNKQFNSLQEGIFVQDNFVCQSRKMNAIKEMIKRIAPSELTVLIQGESGVGKEVVTKLIHCLSPRNDHPLVKINCGLIPENLMESELFGYEAGAFTGANKHGKVGKVELANKGTLFLDEIGEMPLALQVKLLEFLQDREITRVGGTKKIKIDARVIVATNKNLQQMCHEHRFREDLFYRLNVLPVTIPPLRERQEDIPALAEHFLERFNNKYKMNKELSKDVIRAFHEYNWPGNVRELEHVIERAMFVNNSDTIVCENVCDIFKAQPLNQVRVICTDLMPLKQAKNELEAQLVKRAYDIYRSTYKAAKVLQVDQSTVVRLMQKASYAKNA